ncbi:hypothetical protein [Amycolatopsis anabasis]|uniref:hypothetical protein n=1 Tax=Amycolatopsis anabasis TaxID=1840409 RepID=UPI0015D45C61|nr:hypothetical protein [Amycolatopsis anabasis]
MALEDIGVPRKTIYRRCLPGGPWRRLLPGIILLAPSEPTDEQRIRAALLRGGEGAMVTGLWAARRFGLKRIPPPDPDEIHLLVPGKREITSAGFALVERTTRLPSPVVRDEVPVAPLHRAVLDAARRMRDFDAIRAMLAEAVQRRRCKPEALAGELERGSQRGSALPRRAIAELLDGAESVAEADALWLWKRAGLPECERNVPVYDHSGGYIGKPDAWLDAVAFAWEIDSREFHFEVEGYADTLARNARYAAAGIVVLQTLPSRLRTEPAAVIEELMAAYQAARNRPRPAVRTG